MLNSLREDLVDGAQASELLIYATKGLGQHHKKQQVCVGV
jgi:hypothetical protein